MTSRTPFYFFVFLLLFVGFAQMYYRHVNFEIPWLPGEKQHIWTIEAKVSFHARNQAVQVKLATPETQPGFSLISKNATSQGYGVVYQEPNNTLLNNQQGSKIIWNKRNVNGQQELYFKTEFLIDADAQYKHIPTPPEANFEELDEPYQNALENVITQAYDLSFDSLSLAQEIIKQFTQENSQNILLLKDSGLKTEKLLLMALKQAKISARIVKGLYLKDGRRNQTLKPFIQVFANNGQIHLFNPFTGQKGQHKNLILWEHHGLANLEISGGEQSQVVFSMIKSQQAAHSVFKEKNMHSNVLNFSIDSLPLQEQALFKGILLIPIGVFVVVLLRILIGIKTSGTFMPVLIAMAFIQTSLVTGLAGFILIVGVGLIIRSWLSSLNLLLVSRISAVIITVIGIITLFSILSYKIGLSEGLKITFFPMIILAWTIERMSILWEEEGAKEVLIQGSGSLITAVLAYSAMNSEQLRHLSFNFLGLQLILLALILLLGNYTGYRLLELRRFKAFSRNTVKKVS